MNHNIQIISLKSEIDQLQQVYGDPNLHAIYGAGCIDHPKLMFLFMNPTARNISAFPDWKGIHAQWIGTKNIWKLFFQLNLLNKDLYHKTQILKPSDWTSDFALEIYQHLSDQSVYVSNLAKCTQIDARALKNVVFKKYLENTKKEITFVKSQRIISFGNQVTSILLGKNTKVSQYNKNDHENLVINNKSYTVYPTYYPVGQGMRNLSKAVRRIKYLFK